MKAGGLKYISDNAALNDLQRAVGAQTSLSASQTIVALIWKYVLTEANLSQQELKEYTFFKHDRSIPMPQTRLDLDYLVKKIHTYILDQRDISIQRLCTVTSAIFSVGALLGIQSDTPASQLLTELRSSPGVRAWVALLCSLIIGFSHIHSTKLMIPSRYLVGLSRGVAELISTLDILQAELVIPSVKELSLPADAQKVLLRVARVYSNHEIRTAQADALTFMTETYHDMALFVRLLLISFLLNSEMPTMTYSEKQNHAIAALKNVLFYSIMNTIPVTMEFTMRVFLQQGLIRFCLATEFITLFLTPQWIENTMISTLLFRYIVSFYLPFSILSVEEIIARLLTMLSIIKEQHPSPESVSLRAILSAGFNCANEQGLLCNRLLKYMCLKLCDGITQESAQKEVVTYLSELHGIYTFFIPLSACDLPTKAPPFANEIYTDSDNIKHKYQTLDKSIQCLLNFSIHWLTCNSTRFVFLNFVSMLFKSNEIEGANMLMRALLGNGSFITSISPDHFKIAHVVAPWLMECELFKAVRTGPTDLPCVHNAVFPTLDAYSYALEESINSSSYQFLGRIIANIFFAPYHQEALSITWNKLNAIGFANRREVYCGILKELSSISANSKKAKQSPSYLTNLSGIECKRNFYYVTFRSFIEKYLISVLCLTNCSGVMSSIALLPATSLILVHEYIKSRLELANIRSLLCGIILSAHPLVQEFYIWLIIQSITDECIEDISLDNKENTEHHLSRESGWMRSYYRNYVSVAVRMTIHVDWSINKNSANLCSQYLLTNLMKSLKYGSLPAMYCLREFITHLMNTATNPDAANMSPLAESLLNSETCTINADVCIQSIGECPLLNDVCTYSMPEPLSTYLVNPETFLPLLQALPSGVFWKWAVTLNNVSTYEQTSELIVSTINELLHFISTIASKDSRDDTLLTSLHNAFSKAQCSYLPHVQHLSGLCFMLPPQKASSPASNALMKAIWSTFEKSREIPSGQIVETNPFSTDDLGSFFDLSTPDINVIICNIFLPLVLYSTQKVSTVCAVVYGQLIKDILNVMDTHTDLDRPPLSFIVKLFMQLIVALSFSTRQNSTKASKSLPHLFSFLSVKKSEEVCKTDIHLWMIIVVLFYSLVKVFETTQAQFILLGIERCTDILKIASPVLFKKFVHKIMSMCDDSNNVYIKAFRRLHLSDITEGENMSVEDVDRYRAQLLDTLGQTYDKLFLSNNLSLSSMLAALLDE